MLIFHKHSIYFELNNFLNILYIWNDLKLFETA